VSWDVVGITKKEGDWISLQQYISLLLHLVITSVVHNTN